MARRIVIVPLDDSPEGDSDLITLERELQEMGFHYVVTDLT